ncbi:hypothetical protein ACVIKP_006976 [Rhizobium leguminosarum]
MVVSTETVATTNMTGFLASARGLSFLKAAPTAGMRMRESMMLADFAWLIRDSSFETRMANRKPVSPVRF